MRVLVLVLLFRVYCCFVCWFDTWCWVFVFLFDVAGSRFDLVLFGLSCGWGVCGCSVLFFWCFCGFVVLYVCVLWVCVIWTVCHLGSLCFRVDLFGVMFCVYYLWFWVLLIVDFPGFRLVGLLFGGFCFLVFV